jgi:hypothetical protein
VLVLGHHAAVNLPRTLLCPAAVDVWSATAGPREHGRGAADPRTGICRVIVRVPEPTADVVGDELQQGAAARRLPLATGRQRTSRAWSSSKDDIRRTTRLRRTRSPGSVTRCLSATHSTSMVKTHTGPAQQGSSTICVGWQPAPDRKTAIGVRPDRRLAAPADSIPARPSSAPNYPLQCPSLQRKCTRGSTNRHRGGHCRQDARPGVAVASDRADTFRHREREPAAGHSNRGGARNSRRAPACGASDRPSPHCSISSRIACLLAVKQPAHCTFARIAILERAHLPH